MYITNNSAVGLITKISDMLNKKIGPCSYECTWPQLDISS